MKYRTAVTCFYCESDDSAEFVCAECEVYKCLECVSRFEMDEALCVECQQNKADFLEKIVVRIVSPFQTRGNRVLFASGPDLATSLQRAIKAIQNLPAAAQAAEILIRIQAPLREIGS